MKRAKSTKKRRREWSKDMAATYYIDHLNERLKRLESMGKKAPKKKSLPPIGFKYGNNK